MTNVSIFVTRRCNLRCPRCFLKGVHKGVDMTWQQYLDALDKIKQPVNILVFNGGEPTLWPYLSKAISEAKRKNIANSVNVITNGVDRNIEDYGEADRITISHYGGINRSDIVRLKNQGGKRVKIQYVVQLQFPFEINENGLPSECSCKYLSFVEDRIYPCSMSAALNKHNYIHISDNIEKMSDAYNQDLCKVCLNNRKNHKTNRCGLTAEFGIYDSSVSKVFSLGVYGRTIRNLYRKLIK